MEEKIINENINAKKETTKGSQNTANAPTKTKLSKEVVMDKARQAKEDYQEKMKKFTPERRYQRKMLSLVHIAMVLVGNFLVALGFQGFVNANGFLSGSVYGLAGIVTYFLPTIHISLVVFLLSIPMLIVGWKSLNKKIVALTTVSIILQVIFLEAMDGLVIYNNDTLLASIFGGVLIGCGDGLVLRGGSGTNGLHLVAMTIKKKMGLSFSTISMTISFFIVCCSALIFGLEPGLYTLILIFIAAQVGNTVVDGISRKRTAFIVTTKGTEIGEHLMEFLHRGVTMLPGTGLYSGQQTDVLFCVVNVMEVARLKQIVRDVDINAFITVYETAELAGHFNKNSMIFDKASDE